MGPPLLSTVGPQSRWVGAGIVRPSIPNEKTNMKTGIRLAIVIAAASLSACAVAQPRPPVHPAYLHALTDLRYARALLERPDSPAVVGDEEHAVGEIDAAIGEIKKAAYDDGKDLRDHPPVDTRVGYTDRFHQSLQLLNKARKDIEHEEDNPYNQGLQGRVIFHIDEAARAVHHAVGDALR
jgi:hypothetical protein